MTEDELQAWCKNNGGHEILFYTYSHGLVLYSKTLVIGKICNKCGLREEKVLVTEGINLATLVSPLIVY